MAMLKDCAMGCKKEEHLRRKKVYIKYLYKAQRKTLNYKIKK